MSDKIYFRRGNRKDLPTLAGGEPGFCTDTGELFIGSAFGNLPFGNATVTGMTLYVSPTGSDTTGDGTVGSPYATNNYAISKLPKIINHDVIIVSAAGTYAEDIVISGFRGKGTISLFGDTVVSASYVITSFVSSNNTIRVTVRGFRATAPASVGFKHDNCSVTNFNYCSTISAVANYGFGFYNGGYSYTVGCLSSNKAEAVHVEGGNVVTLDTWQAGSGNTVGISCTYGKVAKNSTMPSGTTAELAARGGQIL